MIMMLTSMMLMMELMSINKGTGSSTRHRKQWAMRNYYDLDDAFDHQEKRYGELVGHCMFTNRTASICR